MSAKVRPAHGGYLDAANDAAPRRPSVSAFVTHPTVLSSCTICHGSGTWSYSTTDDEKSEPCSSCASPDPVLARKVLALLTPAQMAFLRRFEHTLANQPITAAEWDAVPRMYVEDDDGVIDDDWNGYLIPPTRHWFAGGRASLGPGAGIATFVSYNPLGLLLRECLMAGADAGLRQ